MHYYDYGYILFLEFGAYNVIKRLEGKNNIFAYKNFITQSKKSSKNPIFIVTEKR